MRFHPLARLLRFQSPIPANSISRRISDLLSRPGAIRPTACDPVAAMEPCTLHNFAAFRVRTNLTPPQITRKSEISKRSKPKIGNLPIPARPVSHAASTPVTLFNSAPILHHHMPGARPHPNISKQSEPNAGKIPIPAAELSARPRTPARLLLYESFSCTQAFCRAHRPQGPLCAVSNWEAGENPARPRHCKRRGSSQMPLSLTGMGRREDSDDAQVRRPARVIAEIFSANNAEAERSAAQGCLI